MLFAGLLMITGVVLGDHANKHSQADRVRDCGDAPGFMLRNPVDGRVAICPEIEPNQFGRMIVEAEPTGNLKEVTAFANSAARKNNISRVVLNLMRQGYTEVLFVISPLAPALVALGLVVEAWAIFFCKRRDE